MGDRRQTENCSSKIIQEVSLIDKDKKKKKNWENDLPKSEWNILPKKMLIISQSNHAMMFTPQHVMPITIAKEYDYKAKRFSPAVEARNLKDQVGGIIYDYVGNIAGEDRVLEISGMLTDLPIPQIQMFLTSYAN